LGKNTLIKSFKHNSNIPFDDLCGEADLNDKLKLFLKSRSSILFNIPLLIPGVVDVLISIQASTLLSLARTRL